MALELGDVRYWMNSGKHMLAVSYSAFDGHRVRLTIGADCLPIPTRRPVQGCYILRVVVELGAKRLELLRTLVPKAASIALLVNPNNSNAEPQTKETQLAAAGLGLHIDVLKASSRADFDSAFSTLVQKRAGALVVSADPFFISQRDQLIALAARHGVPAIYYAREFVEAGGLMSYGSNFADAHRQAGAYAGRLLKGEKPADLPVMLSAKFEFVLNLKVAKTLGVEVPSRPACARR
jgi:putative ABC transport system substrate-binding protein